MHLRTQLTHIMKTKTNITQSIEQHNTTMQNNKQNKTIEQHMNTIYKHRQTIEPHKTTLSHT